MHKFWCTQFLNKSVPYKNRVCCKSVDLIPCIPNTDHVCQSDVEEHSSCQGKDPVGGKAVAGQNAKAHAQVTATCWQEVKEQSLLYAHASVQQDDKVSWWHNEWEKMTKMCQGAVWEQKQNKTNFLYTNWVTWMNNNYEFRLD